MPFKVIQVTDVGTNRKTMRILVCILVINSKLTFYLVPFWSYRRFSFKFWTLCSRAPFGGFRVNVYYSS